MDNETYSRFMLAVKEVVALLKKWLSVERIVIVLEGLQVDHAHVKLYPFRWWKSFEGGTIGEEMAQLEDLQKITEEINS